jgi:hypothetical protein
MQVQVQALAILVRGCHRTHSLRSTSTIYRDAPSTPSHGKHSPWCLERVYLLPRCRAGTVCAIAGICHGSLPCCASWHSEDMYQVQPSLFPSKSSDNRHPRLRVRQSLCVDVKFISCNIHIYRMHTRERATDIWHDYPTTVVDICGFRFH